MTAAVSPLAGDGGFKDLECDEPCTAICFTGEDSVLLAGLVDGSVCTWRTSSENLLWKGAFQEQTHASVRVVVGGPRRRLAALGFSDGALALVDVEACCYPWNMRLPRRRARDSVTAAAFLSHDGSGAADDAQVLVCGTDHGRLHFIDVRLSESSNPVVSVHKQEDYISDICTAGFEQPQEGTACCLLSASGDGTLAIYDCRMGSEGQRVVRRALSTASNDELLTVAMFDNCRQVVCGTQRGFVDVIQWGKWDQLAYRLRIHPTTVNTVVSLDARLALTGADDGVIRVVPVVPQPTAEVLGENFEGMPVEALALNASRERLASCGHSDVIRVWHIAKHLDTVARDGCAHNRGHPMACECRGSDSECSGSISSPEDHGASARIEAPRVSRKRRRKHEHVPSSDAFFGDLL
jgi:WD40 repeat protein